MKDKYQAVWLSHSSISDFLKCPRLYYLRNMYKNPKNGHKMTVMTPPLALGKAVHDTLESLSLVEVDKRDFNSLPKTYESNFSLIKGKLGGFKDDNEENTFFERGKKMIATVVQNPGPLTSKAIKIKSDGDLLSYWFSESENIILCGKIDWIEYLENIDSIHILDFKTGKNEEETDSLQLPIYLLLAQHTQNRPVEKISYWYLESGNLTSMPFPNIDESIAKISEIAKRIRLGRQINYFKCPKNGCFACRPLERILSGEGELVGVSSYKQDIYILPD